MVPIAMPCRIPKGLKQRMHSSTKKVRKKIHTN